MLALKSSPAYHEEEILKKKGLESTYQKSHTDSNCGIEKSLKVDGPAPTAVVEKYQRDSEKKPRRMASP